MSRRPGLTLSQHDAIGLALQGMRDNLVLLCCILDAAYPRKGNKPHDLADEAQTVIDLLRDELEARVFQQHGNHEARRLLSNEADAEWRRLRTLYHRAGREDYQSAEAMDALWKDVLVARHGDPTVKPSTRKKAAILFLREEREARP